MDEQAPQQQPNRISPQEAREMQLAVSTRYKLTFLFGILILTGLFLAVLGSTWQKSSTLRAAGALLFGVGVAAEGVFLCLSCASCYRKATTGESTTETSTSAYYERHFAQQRCRVRYTPEKPVVPTHQTEIGRLEETQSEAPPTRLEEVVQSECAAQQPQAPNRFVNHGSNTTEGHQVLAAALKRNAVTAGDGTGILTTVDSQVDVSRTDLDE